MKKIIEGCIIFAILISITSTIFAKELQKENFVFKGNCKGYLVYQQVAEKINKTKYNYLGAEVPAYRLYFYMTDEELEQYDELMKNALTNEQIWKVLINGYPQKSIKELGCENEEEAYSATAHAIIAMIYNHSIEEYTITEEEGAPRVINAFKNIINNAKKSKATIPLKEIKINPENDQWQEEGENLVKEYSVNDANRKKYKVSIENCEIEGIKVIDSKNNERNEFDINEKFKIIIPKDIEQIKFNIKVESSFDKQPVLAGNRAYHGWKSIDLVAITYENGESTIEENYKKEQKEIKVKPEKKVENSEQKKLPVTGY